MANLDFTADQINKVIGGRLHSPIEDCVGNDWTSGVPLAMAAETEYRFVCNAAILDSKVFPTHVTKIWDSTLNLATFSEMLNTPMIVSNPQFVFSPTVAAAGIITIRTYVNETVPIQLGNPITFPYKATAERVSALITYYAGDSTGFDIKNKGVYFTIEASAAGSAYDPAIINYRT